MKEDARSQDDLPAELAALASRLREEAAALSTSYPAATGSVAPHRAPPVTRAHARWARTLGGWATAAVVCALVTYVLVRQAEELPGGADEAPGNDRPPSIAAQPATGTTPIDSVPPEVELTPAGFRSFSGAEREAVLDLLEHEQAADGLSI